MQIKEIFFDFLALNFPDSNKPFIVETDKSYFTFKGPTLSWQQQLKHLVAFYSRKMLSSKTNYQVDDMEVLANNFCFETMALFLMNAFYLAVIRLDHKLLE